MEEQGQPGDVPGRRAHRTPRADRRLRLRGVVVPAVAALVLAACTGDDPSPDRGTAVPTDDLTDVTIGVLPVLPTAAVQLGIDEGIFAAHGFRVSLETAQGGADLLPRVTDGELKFALSNPLSVMQAQAADRDVRVVTGFSHALATGEDITSVWAQQEADIDGPADLEGATVAVNTRHTMGELSINAVVAEAGGDPTAIEYVEMGFPDMPAALERGDVDAAWAPEPYQTVLRTTGAALVTYNYQETLPGVPTLVVVTSGALADADAGLVADFAAAVDEVTAYAQEHPGLVRETLTTFLDLDRELLSEVVLEEFGAEPDRAALDTLADLALEQGMLEEPVDLDAFLP
ncbi:MAG TPA: ABC transporter substrate-binding protein [Actinomycetaceae bacterium]|nr:ABC transporter substrate-binding protein [Actinomycetaceae bacterium]